MTNGSHRGSDLARLSDITSTEKLLKLIRSKREEAPGPSGANEPPIKKSGRFGLPLPKLISLQKTCTVGIDIGHDYLRMVRATETSGGHWRIDDRKRLALPLKTPKDSPEFGAFLKAALAAICGPAKQSALWVIMPAARVEVRHIRIPKVPKNQISNAVYWTARKEIPFDEKEMIFDFELQGEIIDQGIPKLAAMVYTAPRQEIEDLKGLFSRIGWPLSGISIAPFSLQNLFRTGCISAREGAVASLFIGIDFSRIDIYAGDKLVMTRGIKAGMSSMVETLVDSSNELNKNQGAPLLTIEQGRNIFRSLSPDSPTFGKNDAGLSPKKHSDDVFEMIRPALERLVRQVERTFEHYAATMPGDRISRMFVSGALNIYQPIIDYMGLQLGVTSEALDPLDEIDPASSMDMEESNCISERIDFGTATGLAFSDNDHTPNLMFTYKDKERVASVRRINLAVFAVFIIAALICSGIFIFQNQAIAQKKKAIAWIEIRMADLGPAVDRSQLLKMAAKVNQRRQLSKLYAERYLGMVLISELIELTPANIRFIDLKINLGPAPTGEAVKPTGEAPKALQEEVIVEGLIQGDRKFFETSLASYVMALEASPLFRQVTVQKNVVEPFIKDEALHFILRLMVEAQVHG
jgi:type IV pilus assembly protein PilM